MRGGILNALTRGIFRGCHPCAPGQQGAEAMPHQHNLLDFALIIGLALIAFSLEDRNCCVNCFADFRGKQLELSLAHP